MADEFDNEFDLAVVGAGIVGMMVACIAKRTHPALSIAVLDRSLAGSGTSLYGGAVRIPFGITDTHRRFVRRSEEIFADLDRWAGPLPARKIPVFWVAGADRMAAFRMLLTSDAAHSPTADEMAALQHSLPVLSLSPDDAILVDTAAWHGNPSQTVMHLLARLRQLPDVACYEGVHVTALTDRPDGCDIFTADGQVIRSRHLVRATGPWLNLHQQRLPENGLRIKKVAALHADLAATTDDPIVYFAEDDAYLLPDPQNGRWIFCFASEDWDVEPEISRLSLSARDRATAARTLTRYAPALLDRTRGGRVFCDAYSPTRVPAIARDPQSPRVAHALACSGSGYRLSPAIAEAALDLLGDTLQ
ncbi:FAD-binding oxidoreductase [Bradyrhizobium prioriisuperbiae]|uniref:NAD(P)/FAD-dependent oxidoreductase n=1 Tax=Bradyrhizobium prioriisuperbiae TaxID=2854389 RepID=UPI0028EA792E|nr:FAD-binding oxidoreductase [Bradyrhizobium prioritasuperba]